MREGSCSICGDEGLEGEVLAVEGEVARVRLPGGDADVALDLLDEVRPGDRVVIHLGFAIARVLSEENRP